MKLPLNELYQEMILDHNKSPRNFRSLPNADNSAEGYNPLCGDKVTVYLKMDEGVITEISFEGAGCAISTASASLMTEAVKGKHATDVEQIFRQFRGLVKGAIFTADELLSLGKLAALQGVSQFPVRVKCATLAWHTLRGALEGIKNTVSTE